MLNIRRRLSPGPGPEQGDDDTPVHADMRAPRQAAANAASVDASAPGQPAGPAVQVRRPTPLTTETKKQDMEALLADVLLHLRNDKLNLMPSAMMQRYDKTFRHFIRQVQGNQAQGSRLLARDAPEEQRLTLQEFLSQRADFLDQRKNIGNDADRAMDQLFDTLFATDLRDLTARFKAFLPKKFGKEWERSELDDDKRRDIGKKIITDLFTLNRNLQSGTGESLIAVIKRHYQQGEPEAGREYLAAQVKKAFSRQADCLRVTKALAVFIEFNIDILRDGPDIHAPTAAQLDERAYIEERALRVRRQFEPSAPALPSAPAAAAGMGDATPIAAPDPDAAWRARLESRLFRDGKALVLLKPMELVSGSERLMIACAGQGEYQKPFLRLPQLNRECLAMAINVFLLKGCFNFKVRPIELAVYQACERDYWQRQGLDADTLAPARLDQAAVEILAALGAQDTVVTQELLRYVTRSVDADPTHQEGETSQAMQYLRLLGKQVRSIVFHGDKEMVSGPDWEIQQALIDAVGGSTQRILVHQGVRGATAGGHFFCWLRTSEDRKWNRIESLLHGQAPLPGTPGKALSQAFSKGQTEQMELFYIDAPQGDMSGQRIDESLQFYQEVLSTARYEQAIAALNNFTQAGVGKWAFYQYLAGAEAESDAIPPVAMGFAHAQAAREVSLQDLAGFLNSLDDNPVVEFGQRDWPASTSWPVSSAALDPHSRAGIGASVEVLERSLSRAGDCSKVVLSGWNTSPYCVVAVKGLDGHWHIPLEQDVSLDAGQRRERRSAGLPQQRSLSEFFQDLQLPAGSRISDIHLEMMRLAPSRRSVAAREDLLTVVDLAVEAANQRILAFLDQEEESLGLEAELVRALEETDEAETANPGEGSHGARNAANNDAAAELDSLFGSPAPRNRSASPLFNDSAEESDEASPGPALTEFYSRSQAENTRARNVTSLLARALDGSHVEPNGGPKFAPPRQFQRKALTHLTSTAVQDTLVLTRHNLVSMVASGRVTLRIGEAAGDAILARLSEHEAQDGRYARFLSGEDAAQNREALRSALLQAITEGNAKARHFHIVYFKVPADPAAAGEVQQPSLKLAAVLKRVPGQEQLDIVDLDENSRDVRRAFERRYGSAERWRERSLQISAKRSEDILTALREDFGVQAPRFLENTRTLCEALEEGLQRNGPGRPDPLSRNLWRIVARDNGRDLPMLVNLRGNWLFNVRRERAETLAQAREEALHRKERELALIGRLWSRDKISGEPIQRLRQHMNRQWQREHPEADPDTERFNFFDTVQLIASHPNLEDDPDSPLKKLAVLIDFNVELTFSVLFDNSELIDLCLDEFDDPNELLRFDISNAYAARLHKVYAALGMEAEEEIDPAEAELVRLLHEHNEIHGLHSFRDLLNSLVQRGGGEIVHKDFPDVRRYKIDLDRLGPNGEVESRTVAVLLRSSHTGTIEEFLPDTVSVRERLLAYQFLAPDRARLTRYDRDPRNHVEGHQHGPFTHMATLDRLSRNAADDPEEALTTGLRAMDYLASTATRRTASVVHPAYPEIRMFRTSFQGTQTQRPYHFLGRIQQSRLVHVLPEGLDSFFRMTWKKTDPAMALADVQVLLGHEVFRSETLQALLQPQNMDEDLPDAAFPSWRRFELGEHSVLAKVHDDEIHKLIPDDPDAFDLERRYWLPLRRREHIVEHDKRFGNFLERHRAEDQSRMDFVRQTVRHGAGRQVEGWPQLRVFQVRSRTGAMVEMLARVEDGEIWDAVENGDDARKKLQNAILKEHEQQFRRISRAEARRVAQEAIPYVVTRMLAHQHERDNDRTRATEQTRVQLDIIQRIARRENRAQEEQIGSAHAMQVQTYETLAALGGDVVDLLEALLENDEWEPVPGRPDMRQFNTDVTDDDGEPLRIYAYFNQFEQLVDARVGTDRGLEKLQQTRARNLRALPDVSGSWFSQEEVGEIYLRDHTLRDKKLMELADINHLTLPELLHRTIPMPTKREGERWEFGGEAIRAPDGRSSPYFRSYFVSRGPDEPDAEIHVTFEPLLDKTGRIQRMRLADVRLAPAPRRGGLKLSLPLLAQIRYLERFPARVEMPELEPQQPLSPPATPGGSLGAPTPPPSSPAGVAGHGNRNIWERSPGRFMGEMGNLFGETDMAQLALDDPFLFNGFDMQFTEEDFAGFGNGNHASLTANPGDFAGFDNFVDPTYVGATSIFRSGMHVPANPTAPGQDGDAMQFDPLDMQMDMQMGLDPGLTTGLNTGLDTGLDFWQDAALDARLAAGGDAQLDALPGMPENQAMADEPQTRDQHLAFRTVPQSSGQAPQGGPGDTDPFNLENLFDMSAFAPSPTAGSAHGGHSAAASPAAADEAQQAAPAAPVTAAPADDADTGLRAEWENILFGFNDPNQLPPDIDLDAFLNPHIFRVELPPGPALEEFLPSLKKNHGWEVYKSVADLLCPDGDASFFEQRLQLWVERMTAPYLENEEIKDAPGLTRFTTPILDKEGVPLHILAWRKDGKLIAPWDDTKKNRVRLTEEIKKENQAAPARPRRDRSAAGTAPLNAAQARKIAVSLLLRQDQLEGLAQYLLGDPDREAVLDAIFRNAGRAAGNIEDTHRILHGFVIEGVARALEGQDPTQRQLRIPTGVKRNNRELFLHLILADGHISHFWIPEPVVRAGAQKIKREKTEPDQELGLRYIPSARLPLGAARRKPTQRRQMGTAADGGGAAATNEADNDARPAAGLSPRTTAKRKLEAPSFEPQRKFLRMQETVNPAALSGADAMDLDAAPAGLPDDENIDMLRGGSPLFSRAGSPASVAAPMASPLFVDSGASSPLFVPLGPASPDSSQESLSPLAIDEARSPVGSAASAAAPEPAQQAGVPARGAQAAAILTRQQLLSRTRAVNSLAARAPAQAAQDVPAIVRARAGRTQAMLVQAAREKQLQFQSNRRQAALADPIVPLTRAAGGDDDDGSVEDSVEDGMEAGAASAAMAPAYPDPQRLAGTAPVSAASPASSEESENAAPTVLARVPYRFNNAKGHWTGRRAADFGPHHASWNAAFSQPRSGVAFLMHLSRLCEVQQQLNRGSAVDAGGRIVEYEIVALENTAPLKVWKLVEPNGVVDIMLAPPEQDVLGRQHLERQMLDTARWNASRRLPLAGEIVYTSKAAESNWVGERAAEFGDALELWADAEKITLSGSALLRHLSVQCDAVAAQGGGTPVDEDGQILEFVVGTSRFTPALTVWRKVDDGGGKDGMVNLRLAPPADDIEAREALCKNMESISARSTSQRTAEETSGSGYSKREAEVQWNGTRATEFQPMLDDWNEASLERGIRHSGPALLVHVARLCEQQAGSGGRPVDKEEKISEFSVATHVGGRAFRVWRLLNENGSVALRMAPAGRSKKPRDALVKSMIDADAKRLVWREKKAQKQVGDSFIYDPRAAKAHWTGGRKDALEAKLEELNAARAEEDEDGETAPALSGAKFLLHLHALCDQADADSLGSAIDDDERIFEFSIRTHEDLEPFTVWRMVGESVNLQLAPAPQDKRRRDALQKKMFAGALGAATAKADKQQEDHAVDYPAKAARSHWTKHRINDFDAMRKESNRKDKVERSGAQFLIYLSKLCDAEDAQGKGVVVSGQKFKQFTLRTHTGASPIEVLRLVEGPGLISLRLAPPVGQKEVREELVKSMLKAAKNSVSRLQPKLDKSDGLTLRRWGGPRAAALEPVLKDWIRFAGTEMSGTGLLEYLETECRRLAGLKQATAVDDEGRIEEFQIVAPADALKQKTQAVRKLTIWRMVGESKSVDLRLLPEPQDEATREALMEEMTTGAQMASSRAAGTRRKEDAGSASLKRSAKDAWRALRMQDFDVLRKEANRIGKLDRSGAEFLIHLAGLCNAEIEAGRGEKVDPHGQIVEFSLQLWKRSPKFSVWYDFTHPEAFNLRLAPAAQDREGRRVRQAGMLNGGRYAKLDKQTAQQLAEEIEQKLGR